MKLRIPPFLPAHTILVLAVAYAAGSLWLGLTRLDSIATIADSGAKSAATVQVLEGLLIAVSDIESAGRGFALTADESYLVPFDRSRREVPVLLAELRDRMRDDPAELMTIERLVPLIAERTEISAAGIERKRSAPDKPYGMIFGTRGKESSAEIRAIVMGLVERERDQLVRDRVTLDNALRGARRDMYLMSGLTLLVVLLLYYAVRRLRAFMPFAPVIRVADKVNAAPTAALAERGSGIDTLIGDALLRARLATTDAAQGTPARTRLQSLVELLEQARDEHAVVAHDLGQPPLTAQGLAQAVATLAAGYSRTDGLTIKPTIDRHTRVDSPNVEFLVCRAAEWGLETITLRKRAGEATLLLAEDDGELVLRISALADNPDRPVRLTPGESEEATALQRAAEARGGTFVVTDSTTGFVLALRLPVGRRDVNTPAS